LLSPVLAFTSPASALGALAALPAGAALRSQLFEVDPRDPVVFLAAGLALAAAAAVIREE